MTEHAVAIAGGGPTGMMLAAELQIAGIDVVIVERDRVRISTARARGLHSRSIEVLDQRGVADRFLAEGKTSRSSVLLRPQWTSATSPPVPTVNQPELAEPR